MTKHIIMKKEAIEEALGITLDDEIAGMEITPEGGAVVLRVKEKCKNGQTQ